MGTISQENLEINMEDNANESASSICLRTPLIIAKILENFSDRQLFKTLSFVNKLWNYEARRLLNYRGGYIATLKNCQDLEAFASDVRDMNFIPFSGVGLSINNLEHPAACQPSPTGALDPIIHELCQLLPWKRLYLHVSGNWELSRNCPAFLLMTRALRDFSSSIETMSISLGSARAEFTTQFIQNLAFPSLKKLTIWGHGSSRDNDDEHTNFFKAFVSRAPNLEEIHPDPSYGIMGLKGDLLEGSSAVVCVYTINRLNFYICEGIARALRLGRLDLKAISDRDIVEKFNRRIPKLLQTSRFELGTLSIESVFLVQFMRYGICLENLGSLCIYTHSEALGPVQLQIMDLLKTFDFTRIFPQLTGVSIKNIDERYDLSSAQIRDFMEQGRAALQEPKPDRAVNIKWLILDQDLRNSETPFLSAVFPDIEELSICSGEEPEVPYEGIWKHWIQLKDLKVRINFILRRQYNTEVVNLDSAFCGISPGEVAELREKDDEYLQAVHIVPVAPSILCVNEMRAVTFILRGGEDEPVEEPSAENDVHRTYLFSKVTGLIAFARCPNLSVAFKTDSDQVERELSHMKRYPQVVFFRCQFRTKRGLFR